VLILLPLKARSKWSVSPTCLSCTAAPLLFQLKAAKEVERKQKVVAYARTKLAFLCTATSILCSVAMPVFDCWSLRWRQLSPRRKGNTALCCFIWMKRDEKTKLRVVKLGTR